MELSEWLDYTLFHLGKHAITVHMVAVPVVLLLVAGLVNLTVSRFILRPYFRRMNITALEKSSVRSIKAGMLFFFAMWLSIEILYPELENVETADNWQKAMPWIQTILAALAVIYFFRFVLWLINDVILKNYFARKEIDLGRQFTVTRLIMYFGFVIGIVTVMRILGLELSLLWTGGAALLVGVGLGLQQTFNDLISGIIILVEGTVEVGDIVKVDGMVAKMRKIGLRVSEVETRDFSVLLIPNSKLVVENVNNWSHYDKPTRFQVTVGVSYASDVRKVEKLLLQAAKEHSGVLKRPAPRVQFTEFGSSSLDFTLHFFSRERMAIEFIKSDIRFNVINLFNENDIEIPFPQRDLWLRNPEDLRPAKPKKVKKSEEKPAERKETDLEDVKKDMPSEENNEEDKITDLPEDNFEDIF